MNIAYNLCELGETAIPFVMTGAPLDHEYRKHIQSSGIDSRGINELPEWPHSSHGFIFTDRLQNQFTAFYSGPATTEKYESLLRSFLTDHANQIDFAIVAPDISENMILTAQILDSYSIPFLCDPGQQISDFDDADCVDLVDASSFLIANDYEAKRIGNAVPSLAEKLDVLVVTHGVDGASWYLNGEEHRERAIHVEDVVDPTGCGDAFRSGLVHARMQGAEWRDAIRSGCVVAAINLEHKGSQTHRLDDYESKFNTAWGYLPPWR